MTKRICTVLIALALVVPSFAWRGFVLSRLWAWFVVPLGVPGIGVAHAVGVLLIAGLLRGGRGRDDDDAGDAGVRLLNNQWQSFLFMAAGLLFGWIVTLWMPA